MSTPRKVKIDADVYELVLLQVLARDELGRPTQTRMIHDDDVVDLQGGEQFITAYVPLDTVGPTRPRTRA